MDDFCKAELVLMFMLHDAIHQRKEARILIVPGTECMGSSPTW